MHDLPTKYTGYLKKTQVNKKVEKSSKENTGYLESTKAI